MGDGAALLQVTSYDRLTNEWKAEGADSHAAALLACVPRDAKLVTVIDGHPATRCGSAPSTATASCRSASPSLGRRAI